MSSPDLLEHKVALVAGGGRGIGAAISHGLAEAGAIVAVIDVDPTRAQHVCDEIVASGGQALAVPTDLLDGEQIDAAVDKTIDEFGQIDVLVNNAGGMYSYVSLKPIHEWTDEEWELISSMNLDYVFRTCRAALKPMMAAGTGSIVNIASTGGINAAPRIAPYGAAKAAVMSLTRSLAVEYGHHGIRVNAVAPGTIETVAAAGHRPTENGSAVVDSIPLGRRGRPEDIARAVVFLASPLADYITGETLTVDGGITLRFPLPLQGAHISESP